MTTHDWVLVAAAIAVMLGLWDVAKSIRQAGKWIADAIWHPSWQDPPRRDP